MVYASMVLALKSLLIVDFYYELNEFGFRKYGKSRISREFGPGFWTLLVLKCGSWILTEARITNLWSCVDVLSISPPILDQTHKNKNRQLQSINSETILQMVFK